MKRIISATLILCTALVFNSCALENEEAKSSDIENAHTLMSEENYVEDTISTENIEQSPPSTENHMIEFTYSQALEDYDYFCELLDKSYPFGGVLERKYNITLDTIKEEFKEELEANKDNMDLVVFADIFNNTISKFNGLGHFCLLNYDMYRDHIALKDESINKVLNNERTKEVYEYFYHEKLDPLISWPNYYNTNSSTSSKFFSLDVLDGNIAYIRIPEMKSGAALETEGKKLKQFYSEIANCENLIIDITGNGGGDNRYWMLNIVIPNIKEMIETKTYYFVRDYDANIEYIEGPMSVSGLQLKDLAVNINITESFPQVNREDLKLFDSIYESSLYLSPIEKDQIPYEGNIYLLIDGGVYSSAENFAVFCKKTGFATIIGSNSGGDGSGSNPFITTLPNSGLAIRYTIMYVLNMDGSSSVEYGTSPDYACVGDETPLEACLRYIQESKMK